MSRSFDYTTTTARETDAFNKNHAMFAYQLYEIDEKTEVGVKGQVKTKDFTNF